MSRSVTYRERETDREWDEQPKRTYTTVKRYQVPETVRSTLGRDDDEVKEKIVIRRERREEPAPREELDIKVTERVRERERPREEEDYRFTERVVEREREREPRRDVSYRVIERERERDSDYDDRRSTAGRSDWRYSSNYERDTRDTRDTQTQVRAPSPPAEDRVREYRFERERGWSPERRQTQPFEVEKYSKSTEYFSQPQPAPQQIIIRESAPAPPIIIREERRAPPIIIREERREPQYEFIEREETRETRDESRSLVKRDDPPSPAPDPSPARSTVARSTVARSTAARSSAPEPEKQEEDYFYERRVREVDRAPRRQEDSHERREIRPKDSASNYSSDDSYEYIRKERTYEDDRDHSPHHKRHLAEGAIAGIGAAEILRHHRKSEGKDAGGRIKSTLGGAAVGALGAEVMTRARSRRRGSRSRSRSSSYESRRDRKDKKKHRSRSRSKSMSRKQLAGLAGIAAVGALAGYALKNKGKNETVIVNDAPPRRSRSRGRRGSPDSYMMSEEMNREDDKHRDPGHRNRRIAQAGLASAAAAGIWERVRSKSRGGKDRERSKSRLRTGVPIAAAGLGGAALAGLYEKNKASKEAKRDAIVEDELNRGRRRRSRSRSRSVPAPHPDDRRRVDDRGLIAYGNEPIYPGDERRGYYSDEEPGTYRRRHGGGSGGSSPDTRKRRGSRSRSRGRNLAAAGAAAGLGAVAAHEIGKRNNRQRDDRQQEMYADSQGYGPSEAPYSPQPPGGYLPPQQQTAGFPSEQQYPSSNYFPPPPTGEHVYAPNDPYAQQQQQQQNPYPAYNPADYAQGAPQATAYDQSRGIYGDSDANLGAPYGNETFAGDPRYGAHEDPPQEERGRGREGPENVSAPNSNNNGSLADDESETHDADGMTTPRARSSSRVRFNLDANKMHSPEAPRNNKKTEERYSDTETSGDQKRGHRRRKHRDRDRDRGSESLMNDKYERPPQSTTTEEESDGTVDLPHRFDEQGNRKHDGGDALQDLLGGLASKFLGGAGGGSGGDDHGHGSDRESRSGRRRHRH